MAAAKVLNRPVREKAKTRPAAVESDYGEVSELWRLPLHGCWVNRNLDETGLAFVYLNRLRKNGGLVGAGFLIDVRGVGVKDCFQTRDVPVSKLASFRAARFFGGRLAECPEQRARQLVWGGYWRARARGFPVPGPFRYCCDLLERLDQGEVNPGLPEKDGKTSPRRSANLQPVEA